MRNIIGDTDALRLAVYEVVEKLSTHVITGRAIQLALKDEAKIDEEKFDKIAVDAKETFKRKMRSVLDEIIEEDKIEEKLNHLIALKKASDLTKKGWRPSGDPETDIASHLHYDLNAYVKNLETLRDKMTGELKEKTLAIEALMERVNGMHAHCEDTLNNLGNN